MADLDRPNSHEDRNREHSPSLENGRGESPPPRNPLEPEIVDIWHSEEGSEYARPRNISGPIPLAGGGYRYEFRSHEEPVQAELVDQSPSQVRWKLPFFLYLFTWMTTMAVGVATFGPVGWQFSVALMTILTCHEMGHYLQTRRYKVSASLPFFIPMPLPPFGTMGAVIRMDGRIPDRRALFDIGISGPLAGLVPTIFCIVLGLQYSKLTSMTGFSGQEFGEPLLFQWLIHLTFGALPPDVTVLMHPLAMAGWVGLFLTSLNLMPIGQLDGGHVFYSLLRKKAWDYASLLLLLMVGLVFIFQYWQWSLMLVLLMLMGPRHPPTQRDAVPIGRFRKWLGWATLAFVIVGFTPRPIIFHEDEKPGPPSEQLPVAFQIQEATPFSPSSEGDRG